MNRRRTISGIAIAALVVFFAGAAAAVTVKEYAVIINLAGKQRMLTQKMSKEMLLVALGVEAEQNRAALKKTAALFDKTLNGLIKGNGDLGLPPTTNKSTLGVMKKVKGLWAEFKGVVNGVVGGGAVPLDKVASLNLPLLKKMNAAVRLYEKAAKKEVSMASGVVINLAGKQRMLTQKMSKEIFLVGLGHEADANKAALKKTASLFDRTLKGLKDGDKDLGLSATTDPVIVAQLDVVAGLWKDVKSLVARITDIDAKGVSRDDLETMSRLNLPLLKEMNKAVKMYEKASR